MDKIKLLWSKTNRWHRGLLIFLIVEMRLIPGGRIGFTCNDPALSHPFTGDTITWKQLFAVILLLPLAVMLLVERLYHHDSTKHKKRALRWYKEYTFGVLINLVFVQTLKLLIGSPRPHFFDTCSPIEAKSCEGSEYISQYTCTKAHWLSQSDKSFPSGHTSLAVHAGIFLIYYLHKRTPSSSVIQASQLGLLAATIFCGLSRMLDHRHHWWDVLTGALIGIPILVYTIVYLCNNFKTNQVVKDGEENLNKNNIEIDPSQVQLETKTT